MTQRDPKDLLRFLAEQADEDRQEEAREIATMSDEALDAELRTAGLEPEDIAKEARAIVAEREAKATAPKAAPAASAPSPANVVPLKAPARKAKRSRVLVAAWLAGSAAAAATVSTVVWQQLAARNEPAPTQAPTSPPVPRPPAPDPVQLARQVRDRAFAACDRGEWKACEESLDLALQLDPAGDDSPAVGAARERIQVFWDGEERRAKQGPGVPQPAPSR